MAPEPKQTRSEQRDAARAKAREMREAHKKSEKRRQLGIVAGVVSLVLGIGALIGWSVIANQPAPSLTPTNLSYDNGIRIGNNLEAYTSTHTPGPIGANVPVIKIYLDYQCPVCQAFDVPNSSLIESKVSSGQWIIEYHPISFLDGRGSPNTYSSRAANAAICVSEYDPNKFSTFTDLLYANQPAEQTAGPENDKLIQFTQQVSVQSADKVAKCINDKSFGSWIKSTTDKALNEVIPGSKLKLDGTPFIVVNGQKYNWNTGAELGSPARFEQWVAAAWATKN
jgi:protein-disulfide isomerase